MKMKTKQKKEEKEKKVTHRAKVNVNRGSAPVKIASALYPQDQLASVWGKGVCTNIRCQSLRSAIVRSAKFGTYSDQFSWQTTFSSSFVVLSIFYNRPKCNCSQTSTCSCYDGSVIRCNGSGANGTKGESAFQWIESGFQLMSMMVTKVCTRIMSRNLKKLDPYFASTLLP